MTPFADMYVRSLDDLVTYTANADLDELVQEIEDVLDIDTGDDVVDIFPTNGVLNIVALWRDGEQLAFPFTVGEFWHTIDTLAERAQRRYAVQMLPRAPLSYPPEEVLAEIADFLHTDPLTLLDAVGGGWQPVSDEHLPGVERDTAWYATAEPLQVVMGFTVYDALVVAPVAIPPEPAGPRKFEAGVVLEVPLDKPNTVANLAAAVGEVLKRAGHRCGICQGCREYREVAPRQHRRGRYCRGCLATYFGPITN